MVAICFALCPIVNSSFVFVAAYIKAVAALLIIAATLTFFAFMLNVFGLKAHDLHPKYFFYKVATYLSLLSGTFSLCSIL